MKLEISIIICALALTCTATLTDEQSSKCALCSQFLEVMNAGELESIPSEYNEFLDENNLALCLATCNSANTEKDTNSLELDTVELLSMVGCSICSQMVQGVLSNLYSYDYSSIKRAVKHSCSFLDGMIKTARCKLFVKSRLTQIVDAIFHYHSSPQAVCVKLGQC